MLDTASHALLENEFGSHKDEDVMKQILEKGNVQETTVRFLFVPDPLAPLSLFRILQL